jgi:hypothetical protein
MPDLLINDMRASSGCWNGVITYNKDEKWQLGGP